MSDVFEQLRKAGAGRAMFVDDADSGLKAIIAIDDLTLGPAAGGIRTLAYSSIRLLTRALELRTAKPEIAYYSRAVANELSGRDAQAYRDYRAAAEILPEWSEPREQLRRFSVVKKGG